MRKHIFGRKLKRDTNERKALFRSLASSLVMHERITTTEQKAKALRPYVERLVTKARLGNGSLRLVVGGLSKQAAVKMVDSIGPRFTSRPGGYTRIFHAGNRIADNAPMVVMEWVEKSQIANRKSQIAKKTKSKEVTKTQKTKTSKRAKPLRKEKKA